jgi:hypothetical protein
MGEAMELQIPANINIFGWRAMHGNILS